LVSRKSPANASRPPLFAGSPNTATGKEIAFFFLSILRPFPQFSKAAPLLKTDPLYLPQLDNHRLSHNADRAPHPELVCGCALFVSLLYRCASLPCHLPDAYVSNYRPQKVGFAH